METNPTAACECLAPDNIWRVTYSVHFGQDPCISFCRCYPVRSEAEGFMKSLGEKNDRTISNVELTRYAKVAVEE